MKEESGKLIDKAVRAIKAAEILLKAGSVDFAAGRAYYAMFFTAQALLLKNWIENFDSAKIGVLLKEPQNICACPGECRVAAPIGDSTGVI